VPGATTITGQIFPSGRSVQRKAADSHAPGVIGAPVASSWELTTSADMDAAHRGARTTSGGDAVQASSVTQAHGATSVRVFDHLASAPSTASSGVPATRGQRAAGAAGSGGTAHAGQASVSMSPSASPPVQAKPARLGAVAPAEPESQAPTISCADALLAALPPEQTVDDAQRVFDTAEHEVASVIAEQMTYSDIMAFHAIQRAHAQHPIARRFQRFGGARRSRLLALLADSKVRARAYEREVALQEVATVEQHEPDLVGGVFTATQVQELDDGPMHDIPGRTLEGGLKAAPTRVPRSPAPAVQAKPASEMPLEKNAERDAAALLKAFQGLGTDDQVVYRVLNQPAGIVQAIVRIYDARHNQHTGQGLVEDLRDEFDHAGSQDDWHFVLGQLTRAGISVPDAALRYQRQDPSAEHQGGMRIAASPDVRVAVPGTRVTYTLVHGHKGLHSASAPYRYQWYVLNDAVTSRLLGKPARVEGGDGPQAEAMARFPGNHKVICKVTPRSGRGAGLPTFYEFPQTVVPEGTLAQDALQQAPAAVDPARQLELLETFLHVLREAEKQPGSAALDPETGRSYEQQIAALRNRLASTEGAERIPIRAVHVDREKARVSPLRAFVARAQGQAGEQETWRLVDITNPESRRLSGEYEGTGKDAREAILAALAAWDTRNRYAPGRIQLEVGAEAAGVPIAHTFQTDGMSFWDSISEFFSEVGFWTGMGALAAGVVTAVVPVPGMRVVSGLIWTSILASTAATTINLAQRHAEGMSTAREDAMDVLTIAGNILAGAWLSKARVLLNGQGGTKIGTGLLIGQLGSDGAQGIVLGIEYLDQYERVMAIEDPKQRTDALMELLRSAALAGGMLFLSVRGAKKDLGHLGTAGAQGGAGRPSGTAPGGLGNLAAGSDAAVTGHPRAGHAAGSESAGTSRETSPGPARDRGGGDDAPQSQTPDAGRTKVPPARLPAELVTLRENLTSPEAIAQFDARYQSITKGKPVPTEIELERFQAYLRSKGSTQAEIEAGLAAEWARNHPRSKPPTGDAIDQLPGLRELANRVLRRIEDAKASRPELTQGLDRLRKKVHAEADILSRMESGQLAANNDGTNNVRGMRNNIESVEAELAAALRDPHAVDLSRQFKLNGRKIEIDRITDGGDRWVDVKNYELFGEYSSNMQALMQQADDALHLAEANPNPATGKVPEVVYEFSKGITPEARTMLEKIRVNERGITVVGEVKPLPPRARGVPPQGNRHGVEP
jgi:hypothetical protein